MEEKNEWLFNCPICHKSERLTQLVLERDRAEKRILNTDIVGAAAVHEFPIADPTKQYGVGDEVSTLIIFNDICANCGNTYTFRVLRDIRKMRLNVSNLVKPKDIKLPGKLPFNFKGN